jgi:hypothetical protein
MVSIVIGSFALTITSLFLDISLIIKGARGGVVG